MTPIYPYFMSISDIFVPYGDYFSQANFFVKDAEKSLKNNPMELHLLDYAECLPRLREIFMAIKQQDKDFGGYKFINFSPSAEDKKAMVEMQFDYDIFAEWFFDLIENDYQWKWSLDPKNHCLKGALSCVDEGSPNYKKMVFFYHQEPTKIMLMAYYYDAVLTSGIWEDVDATTFNW